MNRHRNRIWPPVRKDIFFESILPTRGCQISPLSSKERPDNLLIHRLRFLHPEPADKRCFAFPISSLFDEHVVLPNTFQAHDFYSV